MLLEKESYASMKRIRGLPDSEEGDAMFAMMSVCDGVEKSGVVRKPSHVKTKVRMCECAEYAEYAFYSASGRGNES